MPHDLLTMYSVKGIEYSLAALYLVLFIVFWRFVNGGRSIAETETAHEAATYPGLADLFALPEKVFFHPGHAWVRLDEAETVTAGIDDFGQKLIGAVSGVTLPPVGTQVVQGEPAWSVVADGRRVEVLAPVDGVVVAVNPDATSTFGQDAYGAGWLVKLRATRLAADLKHLLSGSMAARWMEDTCERLCRSAGGTQALGAVALDGGVPVEGIARALDPGNWDELVKKVFLT